MTMQASVMQVRYNTRKHEPEEQEHYKSENKFGLKYLDHSFMNDIEINTSNQSFEQNYHQLSQNFNKTTLKMNNNNNTLMSTKRRHTQVRTRIIITKKTRGILNPAIISLVLICYVISNQSIMTLLMSSTRHLNESHQRLDSFKERSLVQLAAANPAPGPSPASARSATSVSHRVPPINGSIFGKRSLDNLVTGKGRPNSSARSANGGRPKSNYNNRQAIIEQSSKPLSYSDIITDIIEDFLALNNDSDPEESAVAFCRMVVYECNQLLTARSRTINKRLDNGK